MSQCRRQHHEKQTLFRALFPAGEWDIVHANYTNVLVYPAVWCVRKWRAWRGAEKNSPAPGVARSEDRIPVAPVNAFLRAQFVALAQWRVPFPFGVSLVLVARRRA